MNPLFAQKEVNTKWLEKDKNIMRQKITCLHYVTICHLAACKVHYVLKLATQLFTSCLCVWKILMLQIYTLRKKGDQNSAPGVLLLQIALFFQRGAFFLNNHVCQKKTPHNKKGAKIALLGTPNYRQPYSTPRGAVLAPFFWVHAVM